MANPLQHFAEKSLVTWRSLGGYSPQYQSSDVTEGEFIFLFLCSKTPSSPRLLATYCGYTVVHFFTV